MEVTASKGFIILQSEGFRISSATGKASDEEPTAVLTPPTSFKVNTLSNSFRCNENRLFRYIALQILRRLLPL